jgi:hypothetical protein
MVGKNDYLFALNCKLSLSLKAGVRFSSSCALGSPAVDFGRPPDCR